MWRLQLERGSWRLKLEADGNRGFNMKEINMGSAHVSNEHGLLSVLPKETSRHLSRILYPEIWPRCIWEGLSMGPT